MRRSVVITLGRFQPPTKAHDALFDYVESLDNRSTEIIFFTSASEDDEDNPIPALEKVEILEQALKPHRVRLASNMFHMLEQVKEYDKVTLVLGKDRMNKAESLVKSAKKYYQYELQIIQRPEGNSDDLHATDLRDAARAGDYQKFTAGVSRRLDRQSIDMLYGMIRHKAGISEEALTEAFDTKTDWKWIWQDDENVWKAHYTAPSNVKYEYSFDYVMDDTWEYTFSAMNIPNNPRGNTGTGSAMEVYSTMIAVLLDFMKQRKPLQIEFEGDALLGKFKLYERMMKRIESQTKALGYALKIQPEYEKFIFTHKDKAKKPTFAQRAFGREEAVAEAFDKPAPWLALNDGVDDRETISFEVDNDRFIVYLIRGFRDYRRGNEEMLLVEFESESYGFGTAGTSKNMIRVFSTVLDIVASYAKKWNVERIAFSGDKEDKHSELYAKMLKNLAKRIKSLGYKWAEAEDREFSTRFHLHKEDVDYLQEDAITEKAKSAKIDPSILRRVYSRGTDDFRHNPGAYKGKTEEEAGMMRVNAFIRGTTKDTIDRDLWQQEVNRRLKLKEAKEKPAHKKIKVTRNLKPQKTRIRVKRARKTK